MGNGLKPTAKVAAGAIVALIVFALQELGVAETAVPVIDKIVLVVSYFCGAWGQKETHVRIVTFTPEGS